jgi:protein N-terminal methyltransferase
VGGHRPPSIILTIRVVAVVLKENVLNGNAKPVPDLDDASVTRSDQHLKRLWKRAGLRIVREEVQKGFPHGLYPVKMYALQPVAWQSPSA